jgi:hypothetical protein
MSKRKSIWLRQVKIGVRRRPAIVIAVTVVLSMFAALTILAFSGALNPVFKQKGQEGRDGIDG